MDGTPFGRYRLIELLGRGGMGEVWRAYDTATDRVVALKLLPANLADDQVFQERFRREAHAAAQLDEPHVVPIHDFGEIDGRLYVTMRLIKGRDLQTVLADGPLSPERAVRIIEQVAHAVQAAHEVGLVHRDIKPSNILLGDNDFAYLIDFGIARAAGQTGLTSTGMTVGTWSYMAPERFQSGTADARADIYALACVLFEALTGNPPFPGDTLEQVAVGHMLQPPPKPSAVQKDVSARMDDVIATGMAKDPDQRYATTVELARAAHEATTVPLPSRLPEHPWPQPDLVAAAPIHGQASQMAPTRVTPVLPPPPEPLSPEAQPTPKRPGWQRPGVVISALVAIVVLLGGGVFAAVSASQHHNSTATPSAAAPPPNTGPFTGTYTADFAAGTTSDGRPRAGVPPATEAWNMRSVCRPTGCVATAARKSGQTTPVSTWVFDDLGGRWQAVGTTRETCGSASVDFWDVITLQTHPDGTLAGEYSSVASNVAASNGCDTLRAVTFTRTGDVDVASLHDPAAQPPRVVSPAEALRGRYRETKASTVGTQDYDYTVTTNCLRTGDRCMSLFHNSDSYVPLVFGSVAITLVMTALGV